MCKPSAGKFIGMAMFVIAAILIFPAITMMLWNWLIPALFSGPVISYWQALGLIILSKILFSGGLRGGHHHRHSRSAQWKSHLREKIEFKQQDKHQVAEELTSKASDNNPKENTANG